MSKFFFRMLAQSYTPNIYTPPLYRYYFIILSPLFFTTISKPIRFEPSIHPPVEWEHRETKTFISLRCNQSRTRLFGPWGPGLCEFRIKRKETASDSICKEVELSQMCLKVKSKLKNLFLCYVFRFYLYLFTAQVHACRNRDRDRDFVRFQSFRS